MTDQNLIFGIDLGTTYSCIAYVDEANRATVVPNAAGDRITPSVIQFMDEERIVGKEAKNSSVLHPEETVEMVKRSMGKDEPHEIEGVPYTPEEISSYILRKVVQDAEQYTNRKITDVVITCPAYFGIPERNATQKAGEIAGLNVRSIINEPTAAAIAYGINEESDKVVLVYDLGGGTFDVTIIKISSGKITVVCTDGDHHLGGRNWDECLVTYLAAQWQEETGSDEDPMDSEETLQDLFVRAEQAKQTLSARQKTDIPVFHEGQRARINLTREKFDELTAALIDRTIMMTHRAIGEAQKRDIKEFDELLLVGGSTKMPQVANRLQSEFGQEPKSFEPDEAVAKGAAIYGQKLLLDQEIRIELGLPETTVADEVTSSIESENIKPEKLKEAQEKVAAKYGITIGAVEKSTTTTITNVTSRSFGIEALNRQDILRVFNIIRCNDQLPAHATQQFSTIQANQETVELKIYDNLSSDEEYDLENSRQIGGTTLKLPSSLPKGAPLEVTFRLNEQGLLHMEAQELTGGNEIELELETEEGSSQEDLTEAVQRSKSIVIS